MTIVNCCVGWWKAELVDTVEEVLICDIDMKIFPDMFCVGAVKKDVINVFLHVRAWRAVSRSSNISSIKFCWRWEFKSDEEPHEEFNFLNDFYFQTQLQFVWELRVSLVVIYISYALLVLFPSVLWFQNKISVFWGTLGCMCSWLRSLCYLRYKKIKLRIPIHCFWVTDLVA